jgi:hypothetical protein
MSRAPWEKKNWKKKNAIADCSANPFIPCAQAQPQGRVRFTMLCIPQSRALSNLGKRKTIKKRIAQGKVYNALHTLSFYSKGIKGRAQANFYS